MLSLGSNRGHNLCYHNYHWRHEGINFNPESGTSIFKVKIANDPTSNLGNPPIMLKLHCNVGKEKKDLVILLNLTSNWCLPIAQKSRYCICVVRKESTILNAKNSCFADSTFVSDYLEGTCFEGF